MSLAGGIAGLSRTMSITGGRSAMAGLGEHITATVRSHASGDGAAFHSVAFWMAACESQQGHHVLVGDIKKAVGSSRERAPLTSVTTLAQPHGEPTEVVVVSHPRKNLLDHGFAPAHRLLLEGLPGRSPEQIHGGDRLQASSASCSKRSPSGLPLRRVRCPRGRPLRERCR